MDRHRLRKKSAILIPMPKVTETAVATAIPGYPSLGKGKQPKTRTKSPIMLMALTKNMVIRGSFTSPLARKRAFEMMRR